MAERIGVLGGGGREDAIAWKLRRDGEDVVLIPRDCPPDLAFADLTDAAKVISACKALGVDFLVIGPEVPLVAGLADALEGSGILAFGPRKAGARLEGSKVFSKEFMAAHGVATAPFQVCRLPQDAENAARKFGGRVAVKYDGLAAGKGVYICDTPKEAAMAVTEAKKTFGSDAVFVVEQALSGWETSIIGVAGGGECRLMSPSQDYKQVFDGGKGPNTGGMGTVTPVPRVTSALMKTIREVIVDPTMAGLAKRGIDFRGVLYFGVMVTPEGPRLLEYNTRFGDPETQVLLPALAEPLAPILRSAAMGLPVGNADFTVHQGSVLCVTLTSKGYPGDYPTGLPISGLEALLPDTQVFHAGTRRSGDGWVTLGGRVLNIVRHGSDMETLRREVYAEVKKIHFDGMHYRTDIGSLAV